MKKWSLLILIITLAVMLATITSHAQGYFGSDGAFHPRGKFPIVLSNETKGGLHRVLDTAERDAIGVDFQEDGMLVYVRSERKTYQLLDGQWVEFGGGGEVPTLQQVTSAGNHTMDSLTIGSTAPPVSQLDIVDGLNYAQFWKSNYSPTGKAVEFKTYSTDQQDTSYLDFTHLWGLELWNTGPGSNNFYYNVGKGGMSYSMYTDTTADGFIIDQGSHVINLSSENEVQHRVAVLALHNGKLELNTSDPVKLLSPYPTLDFDDRAGEPASIRTASGILQYKNREGDWMNFMGSVTDTDVEITDPARGIILRTDDGTRARVTLIKAGNGTLSLKLTAL